MNTRNIFIALMLCFLLYGCEDLFDPAKENIKNKESIYAEPALGEGILLHGYVQMPDYESYSFDDVATDNAVSNDFNNGYLKMAAGSWAANNNPMDMWSRSYNAILYMNLIIAEAEHIPWASDPEASKLFNFRIKGEAYGLRALFMYYLLRAHGGVSQGQLLGVPIITETSGNIANFNQQRADFKSCVEFINSDLDQAEKYLPSDYDDLNTQTGQIPDKYTQEGISSISAYNRVMGVRYRGRMNARIAKSIRAQVNLLAASPAFLNGENNSWEKAAQSAVSILSENNGLAGLASKGWTWYANEAEINAIKDGSNPPEIVWRHRTLTHSGVNGNIEYQLFPPTLYGNGRVNPTQNLVDAFPMKNGYPITDTQHSGYDSKNPYKDRDPRFEAYIVYNGSKLGVNQSIISTISTDDGVDATEKSTRTGYYTRKLTRDKTNLNPSNPASIMMYVARIRYTELYLIYAEAANEAYGPMTSAPGANYSAYDVIKAIRKRAGVGGSTDAYLESVKNDKDSMRELIRNERRIELCFEGHRFWDLRRWKVSVEKLNEPIRGIKGLKDSGAAVFDFSGPYVLATETRKYAPYMYYGPIPYSEDLKWDNLSQNDGWR